MTFAWKWTQFWIMSVLVLSACAPHPGMSSPVPDTSGVETHVERAAIQTPASCGASFVAHDLPFATGIRIRDIGTYASNGAGLAAADFNHDGWIDLAFASIDNEAEILWNRGNLRFEEQALDDSLGRGVSAVDVDGDGWIDLAFTHRGLEGISFWRNLGLDSRGTARFERSSLPGVDSMAYAMAWGDLNGDHRLDLVTGSYNTDLKKHTTAPAELASRMGVFVYTQEEGRFRPQRLGEEAEALSIGLLDLDANGSLDIWVANDFLVHDHIWMNNSGNWLPATPFSQTSYSTMSIDWGDLGNDGSLSLFTTDMNPYDISVRTMASWLPVMDKLEQRHDPDDPQIMQNMLQMRRGDKWRNEASNSGVAATGWSWAARFGDLDNDGKLDLYVVNGMIASNLFSYLPGGELVEENQAFRNLGAGKFTRIREWGLNLKTSGRGMVMADMDNDGDLDIIINNLRSRAQLLENRLCTGESLQVELHWPGSGNSAAIGAWFELHTSVGVLRRDVRASGGYLSTDPARIHFGFPTGTRLDQLDIHWPDGAVSVIHDLKSAEILKVTR